MSPCATAAAARVGLITISSTSKPLALKTPQSLAARSGKAVIVKPALEMRTLARLSWLAAGRALRTISNSAMQICQTNCRGVNRFIRILGTFPLRRFAFTLA
jgi:hypothetical protein